MYEDVVEVRERIRPLKAFESTTEKVKIGINQEKYVVVEDLDLDQVENDLKRLKFEGGFDSVAVVLMHSFACPENELRIGEIAKKIGFSQVSLSHQIMQRIKLVKRGQTCCVDAYLNPHSKWYLFKVLSLQSIGTFRVSREASTISFWIE